MIEIGLGRVPSRILAFGPDTSPLTGTRYPNSATLMALSAHELSLAAIKNLFSMPFYGLCISLQRLRNDEFFKLANERLGDRLRQCFEVAKGF